MRLKYYHIPDYERTKKKPQKDRTEEITEVLKQDIKESAKRGSGLPKGWREIIIK